MNPKEINEELNRQCTTKINVIHVNEMFGFLKKIGSCVFSVRRFLIFDAPDNEQCRRSKEYEEEKDDKETMI